MRENWRTKRETGVRGAAVWRLYKCGYEKTRIGTCLEIHTQQTDTKPHNSQVSLLPGVAALLKHQCTQIMVHVQVRALTHPYRRTHIEKCNSMIFTQCNPGKVFDVS